MNNNRGMNQSEIDNVKEFYCERLIEIWETKPDHLQYEELISIHGLLSFKFWLIRKELKKIFTNN